MFIWWQQKDWLVLEIIRDEKDWQTFLLPRVSSATCSWMGTDTFPLATVFYIQKTVLLLILDLKKAFDSLILIEGTCKILIFFLPLFITYLFFTDILVLSCLFGPFQVIWWNVRAGGRMDGTQFYILGFGAFQSFCIFL